MKSGDGCTTMGTNLHLFAGQNAWLCSAYFTMNLKTATNLTMSLQQTSTNKIYFKNMAK